MEPPCGLIGANEATPHEWHQPTVVQRVSAGEWREGPVLHQRLCANLDSMQLARDCNGWGIRQIGRIRRWQKKTRFCAEKGGLLLIFEEKILKIRSWYFPQG
jgi:hypothetical protein